MHRVLTPILIVCCLAGLLSACYGRVLWGGEQFGYRDAVQYFYPLYARVQAEWRAGHWPLWEPGENGGVPLLANPSAAVLYPGKILYTVLPYAQAARLYVVVHTVLAFLAMAWLLKSWGASAMASALAGLAYGFGAPVLFQYCNVIYLVGAAWAPLGFRGADRWLRLGRRWGLVELAAVLALMVLGGDPESAYVLGVAAAGHAVALTWWPLGGERAWARRWRGRLVSGLIALVLAAVWVWGTLELARRLPGMRPLRPRDLPPAAFPWMRWVRGLIAAIWGAAGLALVAWCWRRKRVPALGTRLLGLSAAALLAGALAAAQLLPALEFTNQTDRASLEDPHDIYPFSLEPLRAIELVWPNVFGTRHRGNRSWLEAIRPRWAEHTRVWVPSLYLGGLTLVLALGAVGFRRSEPQRRWLSAVAVVSLVASLGEYTGPLWWARCHPAVAAAIGPHDPPDTATIRRDGQLRDGDGSVYWVLATVLPGFRRFRYPSKLLCTAALATAGLAGLGWDRLAAGAGRRRTAAAAAALLVVGLAGWLRVTWARQPIVAALQSRSAIMALTMFGPLDAPGAVEALRRSLMHGSIVLAGALGLVWLLRTGRAPAPAAALALIVMTADLALANAPLVVTIPQPLLDSTPEVVRVIAAAERPAARGAAQHPGGPFRVHRMAMWYPAVWGQEPSADRIAEFDRWEHDTIRPKYGLLHGIAYTLSSGVAEIDAYAEFFGAFRIRADAATAGPLGLLPGQPLIVFPRRAFDLWNTRYFVLPADPNGWNDETRAYAAFVNDAERIYPPPGAFAGPDGAARRRRWAAHSDYQVFRNRAAYPRAWVVHDARSLPAEVRSTRAGRDAAIRAILSGSSDPHRTAWLDAGTRAALTAYVAGSPPLPSEMPVISVYRAQEVVLDVALEQPGLVVLADSFAPGWHLTVDGAEAPIHRVNLMMRGAAVLAGRHHLVYRYEPGAFRAGLVLSGATLTILAVLGVRCWSYPRRRSKPAERTSLHSS